MMKQFEDPPETAEGVCRDPVGSDLSEVDCPAPEAAGDKGAKPDGKVSIFTLGHLDIRQNGRSVLPQRKLPRKPVALLLLLIANGVQGSRREALVECLWPGDDRADASRLKVALHRLRQLMGDSAAILSHASAIRINADRVTVDAWELEQLASSGLDPEASPRRALALYAGPFVADIAADPSLLIYQQHLEGRFDAAMLTGMQALVEAGKAHEALECALQGLMRMPSGGQLLPAAMEIARRLGRTTSMAALEAFASVQDGETAP